MNMLLNICVTWFVDHFLFKRLSGSNGSWTNSDDVQTLEDKGGFFRRTRKSAENKARFAKNVGADGKHGKVAYGSAVEVIDSPSEEKVVYTRYFAVSQCDEAIYHSESLTTTHTDYKTMITLYQPRAPGFISCCKSGFGWAVVSSCDEDNKLLYNLQPATKQLILGSYKWKDMNDVWINVPERSFMVYEPLFVKLNQSFKSAKLDSYMLNAAAVASTLDIGEHNVSTSTFEYFKHLIMHRNSTLINTSDTQVMVTNNGQTIGKGDAGRMSMILSASKLIDEGSPIQIDDAECKLPFDWEVRTDFKVLSSSNVDFVEKDIGNGKKAKYPTFKGGKEKKRFRTQFFTLNGMGMAQFAEYAPTPNNLAHGLKRLIGARPGEVMYRRSAVKLGAHLAAVLSRPHWGLEHSSVAIFEMLVGTRVKASSPTSKYINYVWAGEASAARELDSAYDHYMFVADAVASLWGDCTRSRIQAFLDKMSNASHWAYYKIYEECLTFFHPLLSRKTASEIVHVKRKLRIQYVNGALLSDEDDLMVKALDVNIKRELAKFGKAPRLFVSYGSGSMYSPELPEFVKIGIDGEHVLVNNGITMVIHIMAKPKEDSLSVIFTNMYSALSSNNYVYAAIFSDDMCFAGNVHGYPFCCNADISSNDSSQDVPAFLATYACMANFHQARAKGLVTQCMSPLTIRSPTDRDSKMVIKFNGPFEGSGTTLTTTLNHLGSFMICASTLAKLASLTHLNSELLESSLRDAAALVGHVVTMEDCYQSGVINFEGVQFLKRSPFRVGSQWFGSVNLGCILRSLGTVEDDLQAEQLNITHAEFVSLTHEQRIDLFAGNIVRGWCHEPSNPIMRALRTRFSSSNAEVFHDSRLHVFEEVGDLSSYDNTLAIMARYGCSLDELNELAEVILNLRVGHHSSTSMMAKILHKDYGVSYM